MSPAAQPSAAPPSLKVALVSLLHAAVTLAAVPASQATSVTEIIAAQTGAARQYCEDGLYECVPFYHCDSENIVTDGRGLLDIRFGGELTDNAKNSPTRTHSECDDFLDVCCRQPRLAEHRKRPPAAFAPSCGRRNPQGLDVRILGFQDHETQFGEFPWQVALTRRDRKGRTLFVGGGSLIHRQVVLSAAHTVRMYSGLQARLGEWDTQHTTEYYSHLNMAVQRVIRHPDYNGGNLHNDIALLILAAPVDLRPHMDTVCLPPPGFTPLSDCMVTGWGMNAFGSNDYQTVLKSLSLPLVDSSTCESALRRTRLGAFFQLDDSFVCAGGRLGEDACTGDGGSALVCPDPADPGRYVQVGIVSWGIGCGQDGLPGVYADVRQFTGWIAQEIAAAGL
ncbi:phenoloxidase-activating factor 2-like [Pollicipes pollicipes]|uniref:phenoloxidase-activating factor 2-like n=1 Tax=Pollicipes pollicipes TaxID=41117 RepID=UPI00188555E8|nr:phenoloxidase-activating factor 2-like [Pollicipes pollicipes]